MTSNFFQTLVKIEQRGKKQQRLGKMADQSLKELDAEQTCQEILVPPFSKNTNINNPGTHSHLFLSLSRFVNYSTRYITAHSRSCPLCFLTAASIYYSVHFCNLWHYIRLISFISDLKIWTLAATLHALQAYLSSQKTLYFSSGESAKQHKDKSIACVWEEGLAE